MKTRVFFAVFVVFFSRFFPKPALAADPPPPVIDTLIRRVRQELALRDVSRRAELHTFSGTNAARSRQHEFLPRSLRTGFTYITNTTTNGGSDCVVTNFAYEWRPERDAPSGFYRVVSRRGQQRGAHGNRVDRLAYGRRRMNGNGDCHRSAG